MGRIAKGKFQLAPAMPSQVKDDDEAPTWRCYACGSTEGFTSSSDSWTGEWEVTCNSCESAHTFADGEGEPVHECGEHGWECRKCNVACCSECWEWYPKEDDEEPDEYLCPECD